MTTFFAYSWLVLLAFVSLIMIFIVLLQRGRGGGLAGALGGAGGQSAFGTKAGDVFTKITIVLAVIWFILAGSGVWVLRSGGTLYEGGARAVIGDGEEDGESEDAPDALAVPESPSPATEATDDDGPELIAPDTNPEAAPPAATSNGADETETPAPASPPQ